MKRRPFFQPWDGEEDGAVELLRGRKALVGEAHRVRVVDEYGDFARDLAFFDEGADRLHEDENEDRERTETQGEEETSAFFRDERFFKSVDPEDGLGGEGADDCNDGERPRSREGEDRSHPLEGEPERRRRDKESEDGDRHTETRSPPAQEETGKPERAEKQKADRGERGAE